MDKRAPRPTYWPRRALHPLRQALHVAASCDTRDAVFPRRAGVSLFGAYDHGSDQYRDHRREAASQRRPTAPAPARPATPNKDDADACTRCVRMTTRHTGRRSLGRTACGRQATEWTRTTRRSLRRSATRREAHDARKAGRVRHPPAGAQGGAAPHRRTARGGAGGRPVCAGCGTRFTEERWKAIEPARGGSPHATPTRTCATTASSAPTPPNAKPRRPGPSTRSMTRPCPSRSPAAKAPV